MDKRLNDYLAENILTAQEVSDLLHVSKQRLSAIKNQEASGLAPFKNNLYWKPDVIDFKKTRGLKLKSNIQNEILGYYVSDCTATIEQLLTDGTLKIEDISEILIYRYGYDSIRDEHWACDGENFPNVLCNVTGPTFVIKTKDGMEFKFAGLLCGYEGNGTRATVEVLTDVFGINKDSIQKSIYESRSRRIIKDNSGWTVLPGNYEYGMHDFERIPVNFYSYNDSLVLAETRREYFYSEEEKQNFIEFCEWYLPNPDQVTMTKNASISRSGRMYQTVVRDHSGIELWLYNHYIDRQTLLEKLFHTQSKKIIPMKEVLDGVGLYLSPDSIPQNLDGWVNKKVLLYKEM